MQEREFTNMFTFSSGFEGATLKIPASNEDDFGKKQIVLIDRLILRLDLQNLELESRLWKQKISCLERKLIMKRDVFSRRKWQRKIYILKD